MDEMISEYGYGGPFIHLIILADWLIVPAALGVLAVSLSARFLKKDGRIPRLLSIGIGISSALPLLLGCMGFFAEKVMGKKAASAASAEDAVEMLALSSERALHPLIYGGGSTALILILGGIALFLSPGKGNSGESTAGDEVSG